MSAKEFFELMSDSYLDTQFNYWDAVDSANLKFAQNLLNESEIANNVGKTNKIIKRFDKLLKLYNEFNKNFDLYQVDEIVIEEFFALITEQGIFMKITSQQLTLIKGDLLPKLDGLKKVVSGTSEVLEVLKSVAVGLMLEDLRLEMLDDM